jgi:transposase
MDKEWLARKLDAGESLEAIAREVGKHASTVAYWTQKHGLVSAHAGRHAARGGIPRDVLSELVMEGLSVRGIATRLSLSTATVRHWLAKHDLETRRASMLRATREGRARGDDAAMRVCRRHGATAFVLRGDGYYRCARCITQAVSERRRRIKRILVAEAGGQCAICGFARSHAALHFHHIDPATKAFDIRAGGTRALGRIRAEAAKCVLLCANCHAEVESGSTCVVVPSVERGSPG